MIHAGNARTLEALFQDTFTQHHQALSANFLTETDAYEKAREKVRAFLGASSVDEIVFVRPGATPKTPS